MDLHAGHWHAGFFVCLMCPLFTALACFSLMHAGGSSDSTEPHMTSAVDSRNAKQQHVQSQNGDAHALLCKVPMLPLSSVGLAETYAGRLLCPFPAGRHEMTKASLLLHT